MSDFITARQIRTLFGSKSNLARTHVANHYKALKSSAYVQPISSSQIDWTELGEQYNIRNATAGRLFSALHTYIASIALWLAAEAVRQRSEAQWNWDNLCDGSYFQQHGLLNLQLPDWMQSVIATVPSDNFPELDLKTPHGDVLKSLYHDVVPRPVRHANGAYYTPDWLAEYVVEHTGYKGTGTLLDPACGSGTFLVKALERAQQHGETTNILERIAGIDSSDIAVFMAKVSLVLCLPNWDSHTQLPIYHADTLFDDLPLTPFDHVVGNPPWVNWQNLSSDYRERTKPLWQQHRLFAHTGMESILGKGKKDLSTLFTCVVADRYLCDGGTLAFLLSRSTLKSGGAGAGFRNYLADHGPLTVKHIDDVSALTTYGGSKLDTVVLYAEKTHADSQRLASYTLWKSKGRQRQIEDMPIYHILQKTTRHPMYAQPIHSGDASSPWISAPQQALIALRKLIGSSDYEAHAGVYTGGANGVYWLEILDEQNDTLTIRNLADSGKKTVPQVTATIERELVYPLLRGSDVSRWSASPTAYILMVQDAKIRRGYDETWLQEHYPLTYAYLAQFLKMLKARSAYRRYFRQDAPFYTMFDVGDYTFAPYKVVWQGIGARSMQAAVVGPYQGQSVMTNQAMHPFVGLEDQVEAHYVTACLNSLPFNYALLTHSQAGSKSFAQAGILKRLYIPKYDPLDSIHQQLADYSMLAHSDTIKDDLDHLSATLWQITPSELQTMRDNISIWHK